MHVQLHCYNVQLHCVAQMNYLECYQSYFLCINNAKDSKYLSCHELNVMIIVQVQQIGCCITIKTYQVKSTKARLNELVFHLFFFLLLLSLFDLSFLFFFCQMGGKHGEYVKMLHFGTDLKDFDQNHLFPPPNLQALEKQAKPYPRGSSAYNYLQQ